MSGEKLHKSNLQNWASLVAQTVKHLPAIWETWVQSLGWEDLLEKEMATHSSTLGGAWWAAVHGVTKSRTRLSDFTSQPSEMMGMLIILTMVMISQIYTFIKTTCAIKYAQPPICQLLSH